MPRPRHIPPILVGRRYPEAEFTFCFIDIFDYLKIPLVGEALVEAKKDLETDTSMNIHKALVSLPTGDQILELADASINARTQDDVHLLVVQNVG